MEPDDATIDFLRTLARAEAETGEEAWETAAALWERVVAVNPVDGRFWSRLGEARRKAKDYPGAIAAYERALDLRDGYPAETVYAIACCQALLGEREPALSMFERALDLGYRHLDQAGKDDDLVSLRDDERFRELVGLVETSGLSRDEGWRLDLHFLTREVKRRAYDPFRHIPEEEFDAAVARLDETIPRLTDLQIIVEMNRLLRPLGDGHAGVWPPDENEEFRQRLPVQFFLFEEGLFIVAAHPDHADLLGAQVLRFGERTVEDVLAAAGAVVHRDNDNAVWPKHVIPRYLLRILPLLHTLGMADNPRDISLTVRDLSGETRQTSLATDHADPHETDLPYPEGWRFFPATLPSPLPLYLRNLHASYWFTFLREECAVYLQFNAVQDDPPESVADFSERVFRFIDDHEVDKLIIDLRWNGGGNLFLVMPLLHRLIGSKVNQRGRLFVIVGRATFSAAQYGASQIDGHTEAIFVGEPTGSSPTFVGETVGFELPYSKTCANVSDLLWQGTWAMDFRTWIAPTLYTPPTFAAYRENKDPAMDAILACRDHLPGW